MDAASVCTGVGGLDLGLERAGMRVAWQCEADEKCRKVLARHWPEVPCHPDLRSLHAASDFAGGWDSGGGVCGTGCGRRSAFADGEQGAFGPVSLLAGGFPCQDLSVAGMRAGLAGERSALFFDLARVASVVLAPGGWLVIENVDGLLSSGRGRDFAVVLATLAELGFHDLAWRVLNSRYFGVPQRRRRVFIVARRARGRSAAEVLLEPQSGGGDHQAGCKAGSRVASTLVSGSSSRGVSAPGRRQDDDQNIVNALDRNAGGPDDNAAQAGHIVGALTRRDGKGPNSDCDNGQIISPPLLGEGHDASEDGTGRQALISSTLSTNPRGGGGSNGATQAKDLVATADPDREGAPSRLPGRLDDSTRPLACPFDPSPDGPREAQMGNAVTVSVAEWIGRRILDFESGPDLLITTARRRTDD